MIASATSWHVSISGRTSSGSCPPKCSSRALMISIRSSESRPSKTIFVSPFSSLTRSLPIARTCCITACKTLSSSALDATRGLLGAEGDGGSFVVASQSQRRATANNVLSRNDCRQACRWILPLDVLGIEPERTKDDGFRWNLVFGRHVASDRVNRAIPVLVCQHARLRRRSPAARVPRYPTRMPP